VGCRVSYTARRRFGASVLFPHHSAGSSRSLRAGRHLLFVYTTMCLPSRLRHRASNPQSPATRWLLELMPAPRGARRDPEPTRNSPPSSVRRAMSADAWAEHDGVSKQSTMAYQRSVWCKEGGSAGYATTPSRRAASASRLSRVQSVWPDATVDASKWTSIHPRPLPISARRSTNTSTSR
jgi:hypothetical protein